MNNFPYNRVLVTGGTGFIGRALINRLLNAGVACGSLSLPGEVPPEDWRGQVDCIAGDITSMENVAQAAEGVDCIFHLAALLGMGSYADHERVTVGGTRNVLEVAKSNNARVVVTSSIAVYGSCIRDSVCSESTPFGTWSGPYSWAKQKQDALVLEYASKYGVRSTVVRPANVYGAGSVPWVDVVVSALKLGAPIVVDEGEGNSGLIHAGNLADALIATAVSNKSIGLALNACDNIDVSWKQYFRDISACVGLELPTSIPYATLEAMARKDEDPENFVTPTQYASIPLATLELIGSDNRFPSDLLRQLTGWQSRISYEEGIQEIRHYLGEVAG